jgi:hypothetical protein
VTVSPVGAELLNAEGQTHSWTDERTDTQLDGRTDRQTDMTKLIVALRNSGNAPKNVLRVGP